MKAKSLFFFGKKMKAKELRELPLIEVLKTIDIAIRVAKDKIDEIENKEDLKLFLAYLIKEITEFLEEIVKIDLEKETKM
jgi:hypothetical protein